MFHPDGPSLMELAHQALSSTTRGYDLLAPKFDYTPFRTPDVLLAAIAEACGEVDSVLDVCCGTGAAMRMLRPLCRERVVGIDLSEGMLEEAERRLARSPGTAAFELVQQDTMTMSFEQEFDVVTCCGAFGHILEPDQDRFAKRVHAALKPGGRFIFLTAPMPSRLERSWWMARGFNAAMHVRNALLKPPFVMFYLTFTLERASEVLWRHGFQLEVDRPFDGIWGRTCVVQAYKA